LPRATRCVCYMPGHCRRALAKSHAVRCDEFERVDSRSSLNAIVVAPPLRPFMTRNRHSAYWYSARS